MRLLALDTSTRLGGAAIVEDERPLGAVWMGVARDQSERALSVVADLLQATGTARPDAVAGWPVRAPSPGCASAS